MPIAWGNRQEMHRQFPSWSDRVIEDYNCYLQMPEPRDTYSQYYLPIPGELKVNKKIKLLPYSSVGNFRTQWFQAPGELL